MNSLLKNNERFVTADMLQPLPEPVQRYLSYSGVIGQAWIDTVRLKYTGRFRLAADRPWLPIKAEQVYTTNPPGFRWKARLKMAGLWLASGRDTYTAGHGHMFGKVAGLFTIFDARGPELDQGGRLRYLNETTWFPIALLGNNMKWQAIDNRSADVTFTDCGQSVTARLIFDDSGRPINFIAQRYRENKGAYTLDTWTTPFTAWGLIGGLNLPLSGQAVWKFPDGDLPYIDITLTEIEYNRPIDNF